MMKRKHIVARSALELAGALGLKPEDAVAMEFRAILNHKIVELVRTKRITHAEVAHLAGASRTRITALLNGNTQGISTDFLLRILHALGCRMVPTFAPTRSAA